jgi:hypothetical protein
MSRRFLQRKKPDCPRNYFQKVRLGSLASVRDSITSCPAQDASRRKARMEVTVFAEQSCRKYSNYRTLRRARVSVHGDRAR